MRLYSLYHSDIHSGLTKLSKSSLCLTLPFVVCMILAFLLFISFNDVVRGQCPSNFNIPNQIDCKGNIVEFSASFTPGGANFSYQWERERPGEVTFSDIAGAAGNTNTSPIQLRLTNIGVDGTDINQSKYRLKITCSDGVTVFSTNEASLTVNSITAVSGLKNNIICKGQNISFQVTTEGTVPVSYQWIKHHDGGWSDVEGETGPTFTLNNLLPADAGEYTVRAIFPTTVPPGLSHCTETNYNITRSIVVTPTIAGPAKVCVKSEGNVYTTESGNSNYTWNLTGGTITAGGMAKDYTITVTWNTAGAHTVSVNYTNGTSCTPATPTVYDVNVTSLPATSPIYHN